MLETIVRGWKEDCLLVRMTRTVARDRNMIVGKKAWPSVIVFLCHTSANANRTKKSSSNSTAVTNFLFHSE